MAKSKKPYYKNQAERLLERYIMLEDMLIKSHGHIMLLQKIKGRGSEPIDLDLLDFRDEIDANMKKLIKKIDDKLNLFITPNGMK